MVINFKRGNKKDIKNSRLISVLTKVYKVLTKALTKRLEKTKRKPVCVSWIQKLILDDTSQIKRTRRTENI